MGTEIAFKEGLPTGLTDDEASFVYHVEVLGLPIRAAASQAKMPLHKALAPHVVQARETVRKQYATTLRVTREDVMLGISDAIHRAKILADPLTEITGWKEIAKMQGYYAPQKVDVNLNSSVEALSAQVKRMSDEELLQNLGAGSVVDVEFYEVKDDRAD